MKSKRKRPLGVTLLALVFLWIGCFGGLIFPFFLISGLVGRMWDNFTSGIDQSPALANFLVRYGQYIFPLIWWLGYVLYACIGFGLWRLREWARRTVVGLTCFFAAGSMLSVPFHLGPDGLSWSGVLWLVLPFACVVWYLNRPRVRLAFAAEMPIQASGLPPDAKQASSDA